MTPATGAAAARSLIDTVHQLEPLLRAHAAAAERERRLPDEVADAMRAEGLYGLFRPKSFGGLEVDPMTGFRVLEEVARIDSAAGWNLQLSCGIDCFGSYFGEEGAREIFDGRDTVLAGAFFPFRTAVPVDGGYRVTGQTPFVSGAHQAKWFFGLANILENGSQRLDASGAPVTIITVASREDVEILDTWNTLGMRGTGSHDVAMGDVFVPKHRTTLLAPFEKPGSHYQGPLYRYTIWTPIGALATVPLGIARAAIEGLIGVATKKAPAYTVRTLRDRSIVQSQLAQAEARLAAGRAFLYESLQDVWQTATEGQMITMPQKTRVQLAATHAIVEAAAAVGLVQAAVGTTGVRNEGAFQKHFRDVNTLVHHAYVSASRYESVGQLMLGVEPEWPFYGL